MGTPPEIKDACDEAVLVLPWLANGTLGRDEARHLREHLLHCPACRRELRATRIALEIASEATHTSGRAARRLWMGLAAAAALVVSVAGGLVISSTDSDPQPAIQQISVADDAAADEARIFVDGFESGNADRWSG